MRWLRLVASCCVAMAACASPSPPGAYPGELLDPGEIAGDFVIRQHIQGAYGEREVSFDAVVQKQGDTLLVLALTPYGSRALLVEQRGQEVRVESFIPREQPFDPRFILLDVQRTFLLGLPDPPREDGDHKARVGEEIVREHWQGGRLYERRFARRDRRIRGEIIVSYEGGYVRGEAPPTITLVNEWLGYRLTLRTSDFHVL